MDHKLTALQRAFQLARSGQVSRPEEIRRALDVEGYSKNQIRGPVLDQLVQLIRLARQGRMSS
jgi:hypothetical protein